MSTSDPLIDVCVAGLDLVPVEMAITAAGAAIGPPPIAGVMQSQSVILYCNRHSNIERLIERVRSDFADVPTGVTLSELVSAVLSCAALFGVGIMTRQKSTTWRLKPLRRWKQSLPSYNRLADCQPSI